MVAHACSTFSREDQKFKVTLAMQQVQGSENKETHCIPVLGTTGKADESLLVFQAPASSALLGSIPGAKQNPVLTQLGPGILTHQSGTQMGRSAR